MNNLISMNNLQDNPLNRGMLRACVGGHPDYGHCLDALGASLPEECRLGRSFYAGDYSCYVLARDNVAFGLHASMSIWLYLPEDEGLQVIEQLGRSKHENARQLHRLSPGWVSINHLGRDQYRLVRRAYDYALERAQKSGSNKVILPCPNCSQRLRAPNNLGNLTLTCPKCKHQWMWSSGA